MTNIRPFELLLQHDRGSGDTLPAGVTKGDSRVMTVLSKLEHDGRTGKGEWRWSHNLRMHMATAICACLSLAEKDAVREGEPLPKERADINAVYARLRVDVREYLKAEFRTPEDMLPSADSIRKAAQRWATRLLREGHVTDEPPHAEGYKMTDERLRILAKIRDLLLEGFPSPRGEIPYRSLKQAMSLNREIQELVARVELKHPKAVWYMLQDRFPDLYRGVWTTAKMRDNPRTQVCNTACLWLMQTPDCPV